jgi:hypothetical protein
MKQSIWTRLFMTILTAFSVCGSALAAGAIPVPKPGRIGAAVPRPTVPIGDYQRRNPIPTPVYSPVTPSRPVQVQKIPLRPIVQPMTGSLAPTGEQLEVFKPNLTLFSWAAPPGNRHPLQPDLPEQSQGVPSLVETRQRHYPGRYLPEPAGTDSGRGEVKKAVKKCTIHFFTAFFHFTHTMVAPNPPSFKGAISVFSTLGCWSRYSKRPFRSMPVPFPWTRRNRSMPAKRASSMALST